MSENSTSQLQRANPGALRSHLQIELHTRYAISLWQGRRAAEDKSAIMGMPRFFQLAGRINQDSLAMKVMMAVGGFVICPFHRHQEPVFIQQVKQTVPSDIQRIIALSVQQIVQFARTDSWLTTPDAGNKIKNLSMMLLLFSASCVVLAPRLSAVPQELACTRNGYFWGRSLREACRPLFYGTHPVIIFQDIDNRLKKLNFLVRQLKLFFKFPDSLLGCQRDSCLSHRQFPLHQVRKSGPPVKPAIFTQPDKNGGAPLNAISLLGLFIGHLAFFDLLNDGYFKR